MESDYLARYFAVSLTKSPIIECGHGNTYTVNPKSAIFKRHFLLPIFQELFLRIEQEMGTLLLLLTVRVDSGKYDK